MENSGLVFNEYYELYGLNLSPIKNNQEFLIELVKFSLLGLEKDFNIAEFDYKITRLLEYVLRTEDHDLALLFRPWV